MTQVNGNYIDVINIQSRKYIKRIKFVKEEIKLGLFAYNNTTSHKEDLKEFRKILPELINVLTKVSKTLLIHERERRDLYS